MTAFMWAMLACALFVACIVVLVLAKVYFEHGAQMRRGEKMFSKNLPTPPKE